MEAVGQSPTLRCLLGPEDNTSTCMWSGWDVMANVGTSEVALLGTESGRADEEGTREARTSHLL